MTLPNSGIGNRKAVSGLKGWKMRGSSGICASLNPALVQRLQGKYPGIVTNPVKGCRDNDWGTT